MFETDVLLMAMFWVCFALVVYTYPGYPLIIRCLAGLFGRQNCPKEFASDELPTLSLLVSAHNEESVIGARIENALAMDYPADRLEIVIATDGCSDGTASVVARYADRGVRLIEFSERRGKANVLNASIPQVKGSVVILSDANTFSDPKAARRLARWFHDSRIGVVCGRLILTDPKAGSNVDSIYWRFETFLKLYESRLGALLGANGGIYAVRKECFAPIPPDTIVDDFVLPLQARLRTGCGIVYDPDAIAREETPPDIKAEFRRRTRIGAGGFQSIGCLWRLLNPVNGWITFTFVSHKLLRWGCPFFLLVMLLSSLMLLNYPTYQALFLGQLIFYVTSGLVPFLPTRSKALKPLRLMTMFTGMNLALLFGFWRWASGAQQGIWQRTVRPS